MYPYDVFSTKIYENEFMQYRFSDILDFQNSGSQGSKSSENLRPFPEKRAWTKITMHLYFTLKSKIFLSDYQTERYRNS